VSRSSSSRRKGGLWENGRQRRSEADGSSSSNSTGSNTGSATENSHQAKRGQRRGQRRKSDQVRSGVHVTRRLFDALSSELEVLASRAVEFVTWVV
jgi:hypothetical protein